MKVFLGDESNIYTVRNTNLTSTQNSYEGNQLETINWKKVLVTDEKLPKFLFYVKSNHQVIIRNKVNQIIILDTNGI